MCDLTKNLKMAIEKSGLSVNKIAELSGVPQSTVATILKKGVDNAGVKNVMKICDIVGIKVDDLRPTIGPSLSGEALEIAAAFDRADEHIKNIARATFEVNDCSQELKNA